MTVRKGLNRIHTADRRGAALVVAIVCVGIAVAVMFGILRQVVRSRREVDLEQRRAQARWVLESAVDRAAARLAADAAYGGEIWSIPATEFAGRSGAEVRIEVGRIEGKESMRRVRIVADYPAAPSQRVRQTREFPIELVALTGEE